MYDREQDPMYRRKKETEKEQFEQFELPAILEEMDKQRLEDMKVDEESNSMDEFLAMLPDELVEQCRANGHLPPKTGV